MQREILVGCDPELFVRKGDKLLSGHGLIPGTKKAPHKVNCGAVQVDGTALEFNTDPASNSQEFIHNITTVLNQLKEMVPGYDLAIQPVAHFGKEYMATLPEEALVLGCDPDYDAYTGGINAPPNMDNPFRTAAGHVHIGWTKDADINDSSHFGKCIAVVKQLDCILGVSSILFDKDGAERRQMYGKAGAFRPKSYGVEYRPLSNKWISSTDLMDFVFTKTVEGVHMLMNGKPVFNHITDAQEVINSSNEERAKKIVCDDLGFNRGWGHIFNGAV